MTTLIKKTSLNSIHLICICLLTLGSLVGCSNAEAPASEPKSTVTPANAAQHQDLQPQAQVQTNELELEEDELDVEEESADAVFSVPKLEFEATRATVEKSFKRAIKSFDDEIESAKKEDRKMTILNIKNTAVSIWYQEGNPVKVAYGIKDTNGEFTKKFVYYLSDNKPWYAEDDQYRYIYSNDLIRYRLDKNWQAGRINISEFSQEKKYIREIISQILSEVKK